MQVSGGLQQPLQALFLQLAQASAVGLIDLKVKHTSDPVPTGADAADTPSERQENGHGRPLESHKQQTNTTGQHFPFVCPRSEDTLCSQWPCLAQQLHAANTLLRETQDLLCSRQKTARGHVQCHSCMRIQDICHCRCCQLT